MNQVGTFYTADADLSIIKSDSPDPVVAGQDVTYTITATNNSTTTIANGVVITDTLDPNVTLKDAGGGTYSAGPPATVTWTVGALSQGQSVSKRSSSR